MWAGRSRPVRAAPALSRPPPHLAASRRGSSRAAATANRGSSTRSRRARADGPSPSALARTARVVFLRARPEMSPPCRGVCMERRTTQVSKQRAGRERARSPPAHPPPWPHSANRKHASKVPIRNWVSCSLAAFECPISSKSSDASLPKGGGWGGEGREAGYGLGQGRAGARCTAALRTQSPAPPTPG